MPGALPFAFSLSGEITKIGAYAGFAAIVGLAVMALLYFSQAREVKRLREWTAGEVPVTPETVGEQLARQAQAAARVGTPAVVVTPRAGPAAPVPAAATRPAGAPLAPAGVGAPATAAATRVNAPVRPAVAALAGAGAPAVEEPTPPPAPTPVPTSAPVPPEPAPEAPAAPPPPAIAPAAPLRPGMPPAATVAAARATSRPATGSAEANGGPGNGARAAGPPATPTATNPRPAPAPLRETRPPARTPLAQARRSGGRGDGEIRDRLIRRWTALLVGLALGGALIAGLALGGVFSGSSSKPASVARPAARGQNGLTPVPGRPTTVTVLNGTTVSGLALQVAQQLVRDGFRQGGVGNAADQTRSATIVSYAPAYRRQARAVARALKVSDLRPIDAATQQVAQQIPGSNPTVVVTVGSDRTTTP